MDSFLIRGAMVVDGSGQPPFRADMLTAGNRIRTIEPEVQEPAEAVIEADGLVLSPGFIDIHSHTDGTIFKHPLSESKILQGVTGEVIGNCGIGAFPVNPERKKLLMDYVKMLDFHLPPAGLDWTDFAHYANRLEGLGLGLNLMPLVGHGTLRIAAMGSDDRAPSPIELKQMEDLLAEMLRQGAWGMSTGLIYPPGSFAKTEELIALGKVLARFGALYTSHIRGESGTLMQSLDEAIRIGREGGARVEISHLKALGKDFWGQGKEVLAKLEKARQEGVDIMADQYPYEATSTSLTAMVPQWAHAGGVAELLKRLAAPELRERLSGEIRQAMNTRGGPERVLIASLGSSGSAGLSGKTLGQIAALWSCPPEEAVIRLVLQEKGTAIAVYFSLSAKDVETIMTSDRVAVGSDGQGMNAAEDAAESTHPRSYGTFARVLGQYVRKQGLLSLPTAIYKMTGLPSSRLGLRDRGRLRPGYAADLVLFDPAKIQDQADFKNPHQYPTGIVHVWVNGILVVEDGTLTGNAPGHVLRKNLS